VAGGIPFGEWAAFYGVQPEDIINYPGNKIDVSAITDFQNASIEPGKWLIIPVEAASLSTGARRWA